MSEAKKLTIRNTDGSVPIYNWNDKTEVAIKRVLREGEHYKNMMTVYRLIGSEYLGVSDFCGGQQKNDAKKCLLQYARIELADDGIVVQVNSFLHAETHNQSIPIIPDSDLVMYLNSNRVTIYIRRILLYSFSWY